MSDDLMIERFFNDEVDKCLLKNKIDRWEFEKKDSKKEISDQ